MTDYSKAAFTSVYRYEYVVQKSHAHFSIAGGGFGSTTVTITHDLGYKPYFKAWITFASGKKFRIFSGTSSYDIDGNGVQVDSVNVTTTTLVVNLSNFGVPAVTGIVYYRIYAEPQA